MAALRLAWRVGPNWISHRSRFINTAKYAREQAAGKFIVPAIGSRIPDAVPIRNSDDLNAANTAVMVHGQKLYALWEGGSAYQVDPETLASKGPTFWRDDLASVPFSAHPLHERDGSVHTLKTIERPYMEALRWRPERGCRALVLDKNDLDRQRWFGLPAGAAYHYGPAQQRGRELHLSACWNRNGSEAVSPFRSELQGVPLRVDMGCSVEHIVLNLDSGRANIKTVLHGSVDFPHWNQAEATGAWFALTGSDQSESGYFDKVVRVDAAGAIADQYHYGANCVVEEH